MTRDEEVYIAELREHASKTRVLFSNAQKAERERMVVRAFLRCVGEPFADFEIEASTIEPVDTVFRAARFQVRDIVGNRKRGRDWAEREEKYQQVEQTSDLLEPWVSSAPMTFGEISAEIANALAKKASRYGPEGCAALDALVYVDLHNHHLYPPEPKLDDSVAYELERQGWRSVSFVFLPYGVVLAAKSDAPDFLKRRVGRILNEWHYPDGWFEASTGRLPERKLAPLPGTAPDGTWRIGTIDHDEADGRLAIFAIVARPASEPLNLRGAETGDLIGTGFYIVPNGGFATAKHVALEAQEALSKKERYVGIVYTLPNGLSVFRPIRNFCLHPTADLAFGIPHEIIDNTTDKPFRAKVLSLDRDAPGIDSSVSTWAYPLHRKDRDADGREILQMQPDFYNGRLLEVYQDRGPSAKLRPPYYQTDIHLHGGSSGGPVFNEAGHVFGVASCSYDGAEDVAFVTPIAPIFEIEVPDVDLSDGQGRRTIVVGDIARIGRIVVR